MGENKKKLREHSYASHIPKISIMFDQLEDRMK